MPIRLYKPGSRKGNRTWVARVSAHGKRYEFATGEKNKGDAKAVADRFEAQLTAGSGGASGLTPLSKFPALADAYIAAMRPSRNTLRYLAKLKTHFKDTAIQDIGSAELMAAAHALYPGAADATKNRQAIAPAAAALHLASDDKIIPERRFRRLREQEAEWRSADFADMLAIERRAIDAGKHGLALAMCIWRRQGFRIGESIGIDWDRNVDLTRQVFQLRVTKAAKVKIIAMDPEVFEALAAVPERERHGRVLPWVSRSSYYKHLHKIAGELGIRFTPHMARHAFGTDLNAQNATEADLVNAGSWTSARSVKRYVHTDIDRGREILSRREPKARVRKSGG